MGTKTWNKRVTEQSSSDNPDHLMNCAVCKENYSVKIRKVDVGNSDFLAISIKEMIHIKLKTPTLISSYFHFGTSFALGII